MSDPYIPPGVDPQMWMGFEQRIRERRYKALLDTIHNAIESGDRVAALLAIEQARELDPHASELTDALEHATALSDVVRPAATPEHAWSRVFGAIAMLLVGVSMLIGLDWMRTAERAVAAVPKIVPVAAPAPIEAVVPMPVAVPAMPVPVPVATTLRQAPAALASATRRAPTATRARSPRAKVEPERARGWGRVFRPTARFFGTTLPKVLGIEVVHDDDAKQPSPRQRI